MVHMFDGYALVVRLEVDGASNSVRASHRYVESQAYERYRAAGRMAWREFATPVPHQRLVDKAGEVAGMVLGALGLAQGVTDNASVNILPQGDQVWALTETTAGTIALDPATLRTLGRVRYDDSLRGDLTTAHPKRLSNGDLVNLLSAPGVGFTVYRQPPRPAGAAATISPPRQRVATVPHRRPLSPAWVHDFPGSNEHIVIPETPLYFNLGSLMSGATTDHLFMDWVPEDGARLHVVRLADGAVRTFLLPPFFAFHWANAFESADGRHLCIDGAVYDDPEIVNHLSLRTCRAGPGGGGAAGTLPRSTLRRLTLDLGSPAAAAADDDDDAAAKAAAAPPRWEPLVEDESSHGHFIEFPAINPARRGGAHRYVWSTCAVRPTNLSNALARVDTLEKRCLVWHEAGGVVGEPTFVAAPGSGEEDDGVVLSVLTQADGRSALLVLDGRTHREVARAVLPCALPNGFHGAFLRT